MEEIFVTIEGTGGTYEVSNLGKIRCGEEFIPYEVEQTGYCKVRIPLLIGTRWFSLHRVVATYFCEGRTEEKCQVNHIDGNKENNCASNLEWVTNTENQRHRIDVLGKDMRGEHNPMYGVKGENSPVFKGYINMVNPETNEIIASYAGSGEAARANNFNASNILRVVNKNKKYHGYYWTRDEK